MRDSLLNFSKRWENLKNLPLTIILSYFMKAVLFFSLFYFFVHGDFLFVCATIIAILISLLPNIFERSLKITLPFEIDFIITLSILLHLFFGDVMNFYERIPGYDKFLHFFITFFISLTSFIIVFALHYSGKLRLTPGFVGFFTVVFSMAMGVVWEIGEFIADKFFQVGAQGGLDDTMFDLILDTCGGSMAALLGTIYVKNLKPAEKRIMSLPFAIAWEKLMEKARGMKK